jgi:hypothetical protein
MWAGGIVVDPPCLDGPARHRQAAEQSLVEAFIAEAAVEALDEAVLLRLAGSDVVPEDGAVLLPVNRRANGTPYRRPKGTP